VGLEAPWTINWTHAFGVELTHWDTAPPSEPFSVRRGEEVTLPLEGSSLWPPAAQSGDRIIQWERTVRSAAGVDLLWVPVPNGTFRVEQQTGGQQFDRLGLRATVIDTVTQEQWGPFTWLMIEVN